MPTRNTDPQAQRLLDTFLSNTAFFYKGIPTDNFKTTARGQKRTFRYQCVERPLNLKDAERHLAGEVQIVAQPLLSDGTCYWADADCDNYVALDNFTPPEELRSILNFSRSKSGGIHATAVFASPQSATTAQRLMERWARELGWYPCEINPKQTELTAAAPKGNGVALPYFGLEAMPEVVKFDVTKWLIDSATEKGTAEYTGAPATTSAKDNFEDAGWWCDDALLAMLIFYKENFPGFNFKECGRGYAVPCPGNPVLGGWPDGAKHSTEDPLLDGFRRSTDHESLVFIRNGWPKFRCVHAHCDNAPKKTFNNWREFWDPLWLWEFIEWQDADMERLNHVR